MSNNKLPQPQIKSFLNELTVQGQHRLDDSILDWNVLVDNLMVRHGIEKQTPMVNMTSGEFKNRGYVISSTDPVYQWGVGHGYITYDNRCRFVLLDDDGLPISVLTVENDMFSFYGSRELRADLFKVMPAIFSPKEWAADTIEYIEICGFGENGAPKLKKHQLCSLNTVRPEFYPYLDGGFESLIRDFILSDESILILGGIPGSGKTIGMRETMIALGLQPIIAQDAHAILHPMFINSIFSLHSKMYEESIKKPTPADLILTTWNKEFDNMMDEHFPHNRAKHNTLALGTDPGITSNNIYGLVNHPRFHGGLDEEPTIEVTYGDIPSLPIMFIEDADGLLGALQDGNKLMQNLRNRTDGINKEHPVKVVFTTNKDNPDDFDKALLRDGRCYGFFPFRKLTPEEAVVARHAAGMEPFEEIPTNPVCLATALRKPRKKIFQDSRSGRIGFN